MKAVLISINKPHTDNIFTHKKKKIEWRKKPLPLTTHYCYETKNKGGIGKVRGQFEVVQNIEFDPLNHRLYSPDLIEDGCVPIEDLIEYANGDVIYGNVLESVEEYDKPKELRRFQKPCICTSEYEGEEYMDCLNCDLAGDSDYGIVACNRPITRPPQSWCYVEVLKGE